MIYRLLAGYLLVFLLACLAWYRLMNKPQCCKCKHWSSMTGFCRVFSAKTVYNKCCIYFTRRKGR
jgi:hypothetical protein